MTVWTEEQNFRYRKTRENPDKYLQIETQVCIIQTYFQRKPVHVGSEVRTEVVMKIAGGKQCFHAGMLLGLYFDPEDRGSMFFRNVSWLSADYAALYPSKPLQFRGPKQYGWPAVRCNHGVVSGQTRNSYLPIQITWCRNNEEWSRRWIEPHDEGLHNLHSTLAPLNSEGQNGRRPVTHIGKS
jgi:hypothetical protein